MAVDSPGDRGSMDTEACESGRIGTIGNRVWGNSPWVQIPPPPLCRLHVSTATIFTFGCDTDRDGVAVDVNDLLLASRTGHSFLGASPTRDHPKCLELLTFPVVP